MKRIAYLLLVLLLSAAPRLGMAQDTARRILPYAGHSTKFAVMVRDVQHFEGAIRTAGELGVDTRHFSFEIVVLGPMAKSLVEDSTVKAGIDRCEQLGVQIVVCEHAMAHYQVLKAQLDKRIRTTPNGSIYMFELQDKGYNTLVL